VRPQPTPLVYVIKQGDNLLKVAKKFNVPLEDLLAANKDTITNPDKIAIGDQIIIPTSPPGSGGASQAPALSPSASP
jgi:LysM repeat protein